MIILSLDLAARTGWSVADGQNITGHGVEHFTAKDPFKRALQLREWFKGGALKLKIDHVFVEQYYPSQPFIGKNGKVQSSSNFDVVRGLISMHTAIGMTCHELNIPRDEVAIASWRNHFIGTTKAPKEIKKPAHRTKWLKQAVIDRCNERGWPVKEDNEADSLGVLDFALCKLYPSYGANSTPLFAGAA